MSSFFHSRQLPLWINTQKPLAFGANLFSAATEKPDLEVS